MSSISPTFAIGMIALAATVAIALLLAVSVARVRAGRTRVPAERQPVGPGRGSQPGSRPEATGAPRANDAAANASRTRRRAAAWLDEDAPKSLGESDRARYLAAWRHIRSIFVDDPRAAVLDADRLVANVLRARGYRLPDSEMNEPMDSGEISDLRAAADTSDNADTSATRDTSGHARETDAITRYWSGHEVTVRRVDPSLPTEELWAAMADYQAALDVLTETAEPAPPEPSPAAAGGAGR